MGIVKSTSTSSFYIKNKKRREEVEEERKQDENERMERRDGEEVHNLENKQTVLLYVMCIYQEAHAHIQSEM